MSFDGAKMPSRRLITPTILYSIHIIFRDAVPRVYIEAENIDSGVILYSS